MNFWKKIVKTFKDSPLTKTANANNILKLIKKPTTYANQFLKLAKGKGGGKFGGLGT